MFIYTGASIIGHNVVIFEKKNRFGKKRDLDLQYWNRKGRYWKLKNSFGKGAGRGCGGSRVVGRVFTYDIFYDVERSWFWRCLNYPNDIEVCQSKRICWDNKIYSSLRRWGKEKISFSKFYFQMYNNHVFYFISNFYWINHDLEGKGGFFNINVWRLIRSEVTHVRDEKNFR